MNIILSDYTVVTVAIKTIDETTHVEPRTEYECVMQAFNPKEIPMTWGKSIRVEAIVHKSSLQSIMEKASGSTICYKDDNYIINKVDEVIGKSMKNGFRCFIFEALCYFPIEV